MTGDLLVNVLTLAAKAVGLADAPYVLAVKVAMDFVGVKDPGVFADALQAIHNTPDRGCRVQRIRDAAKRLREGS